MSQVRSKAATVAFDMCRNKVAAYGEYLPWEKITDFDWEQVEQLYISGSENAGNMQEGCYVDQERVLLLGAMETQIRMCISRCGRKMRVLELADASIHKIPEEVRSLRSLRCLNLQGLHLGELPDWLPEITEQFTVNASVCECGENKAVVNFCNTEVSGAEMSLFEQPYELVSKWFEERGRGDAVPLNEVKVVFLGDGDVGKTTTIARLLGDGTKLPASAFNGSAGAGIAIYDKEYMLDGQRIRVHFWDFGSREILRSMHRMFLTERTLYVVLVNVRTDTQEERARYWLHNIKSFAGDAPVLLVLNKIDLNPSASIDSANLRRMYGGLKDVIPMSAMGYSPEKFHNTLTKALLKQMREMDTLGTLWPRSWLELKSRLQQWPGYRIHGSVYEGLCAACGVEQNRDELLRWMNDLGVVCSYSRCSDPNDQVIVRPEWLINAVYSILNNKFDETINGIIPHETIYQMLCDHGMGRTAFRRVRGDISYDPLEAECILEILRQYRLSFKIAEDAEFIPVLSKSAAMPVAKEYENAPGILEFRMSFDYLPDNVIHRLMEEMRQDLDVQNIWRSGALFVRQDTSLSAVVKSEGDILRIFVRSDNHRHLPDTYLHIIKGNIDRIVAEMNLRQPHSEVIYKAEGITEAFDYEDLIIALQEGSRTYRSRKRRRAIPIHEILNPSGWEDGLLLDRLEDDIIRACMQLQGSSRFQGAAKDVWDAAVQDALLDNGYLVREQIPWGNIGKKRSEELELDIRLNRDIPLTICGVLKVSDRSGPAWNARLERLLTDYASYGLHHLFLVTYVACEKADFQGIWEPLDEHIRQISLGGSYFRCDLTAIGNPRYIRAAKCSYDRAGVPTTVCHIFVRMGSAPAEDTAHGVPGLPQAEQRTVRTEPAKPEPVMPAASVLQEYRVVFLGDSEAGKSQIMHRVRNPEKEASDYTSKTTVGIDIFRQVETINDRPVRINYWDFGGQEILHAMHRIFLAENTLYVIILNVRNDTQDAQANFWLRYVEAYAHDAPVLLVMNKKDQNDRASLNLPVLRRTFKRFFSAEDVLKISAIAEKQEFRKEFAEKLRACIGRHLGKTEDLTAQQSRIRDAVEKKKAVEKIISIDEFIDICRNESLYAGDEQTSLMNRFNDSGVMVHFKGKTLMFMNPEWITKTLYRILEEGGKVAKNGVILRSDLQTLCRENPDKWRGSEDADHLVAIMRDYDFSFQYEKSDPKEKDLQDKEFIPVLCRREEPDDVEEQITRENILEMRIEFLYLPSDVLYQLMVQCKDDLEPSMVWASGAKLRFGSANYAFVRRDENTLSIFGYYPSEGTREKTVKYMYGLVEKIRGIASGRQSTARIQQIRIGYMVGSRMEYFDLHQLENAKECGVYYTVSPGEEIRKIAVCDILDQQDRSVERATDLLLADLAVACSQLQQRAAFLDPQEDVRNSFIVDVMKSNYNITDQTLIGKATSGKRQNELDMLIRFPNKEPWMIIEALVVSPKKSITVWNSHLDKLVGRYNASWGIRKLALVSYVDCSEAEFEKLYRKYRDNMKTHSPKDARIQESSFDECTGLSHNAYLKVDRCAYTKQENIVMVYHYFVRMETKEEVRQADLESARSEAVL